MHLHEYARFMLVAAKEPSASWGTAVIRLSSAIEAEVKSAVEDIDMLKSGIANLTLGQIVKFFRRLKVDCQPGWESLQARTQDADFFVDVLPTELGRLNRIRVETDSAHGKLDGRKATADDGELAWQVLARVLPPLCREHHALRGFRG
jgi:hypothetical protein